MKRLAIFASGSGSNAEEIIKYFSGHPEIEAGLVVSDNPYAGVLERSQKFKISTYVHASEELENGKLTKKLREEKIDLIVLAGYLKKIPQEMITAYPNKIVNVHPALLPKYGGKGMYGMNVHKAVEESGDEESGMTVHFVNEQYDEGAIIEQHKCKISKADTAEEIAAKVLKLEHKYFAPCIEKVLIK